MKAASIALTAGVMACLGLRPAAFAAEGGKATETILHTFGSGTDGKIPDAGLIDENGTLYGTTSVGGAYNHGSVFAVDPTTGAETVIHDFGGPPDGQGPQAVLIELKGKLYGTMPYGGNAACQYGCGAVFSLDPATGAEKTLYAFNGKKDGEYPWAGLIAANGTLYGTTLDGGTSDNGTVFAVDPNTGAETVVHSFGSGTDSQEPEGSLLAVNGTLYGVTLFGGAHGFGTVFSLDPGTGAAQVLHSFCGKKCLDGAFPYAGLIAVNGKLYGTTSEGGRKACCGTVFVVDPTTGAEKVVYAFNGNGTDGQQPLDNLIHVNGTFYGTTSQGGDANYGTVFALTKR